MELYNHNKVTYNKACEILDETNRVCIVQATGTGKSFVTMKLFEDYFRGLKKLYVIPKKVISDSISLYDDWDSSQTDFITYSKLSMMDKYELEELSSKYPVVLCDEFHHAGAPKWQRAIKYLEKYASYFIGLSATPLRYLDNRRDMAKEFFKDSVVYGPTLQEAIRDGILPEFQYVTLLYDIREFIERCNYNELPTELKLKIDKLRLTEEASYELGVRIRKYLNKENKKWIVFCSTIEQMQDIELDIKNWFDTDNILINKVSSNMSSKQVRENIQEFSRSDKLSVLCTVDILNEGVHVDGATGIIMLRKTDSVTVFLQQLGRALSASNKTITPQIIDVVGNYENIGKITDVVKSLQHQRKEINKEKPDVTMGTDLFIVDDLLKSANEILEEIYKLKLPIVWEDWEDDIIRYDYPIVGTSCYKSLNHKTKAECVRRARDLGIRYTNIWEEEEDKIIMTYYPKEGKECAKRLPRRTKSAVSSRASTLKVKYVGNWSLEEDIILMTYYRIEKEDCFKRLPNKSKEECRKRVIKLHLSW